MPAHINNNFSLSALNRLPFSTESGFYLVAVFSTIWINHFSDGSHWFHLILLLLTFLSANIILKNKTSALLLCLMCFTFFFFPDTLGLLMLIPFILWVLLGTVPLFQKLSQLFSVTINQTQKRRRRRLRIAHSKKSEYLLILSTVWILVSVTCLIFNKGITPEPLTSGIILGIPAGLITLLSIQHPALRKAGRREDSLLTFLRDTSTILVFIFSVLTTLAIFEWFPNNYPENAWPFIGAPLINSIFSIPLIEPFAVWKFWLFPLVLILLCGGIVLILLRLKQEHTLFFPTYCGIWFIFGLFFTWVALPIVNPPVKSQWITYAKENHIDIKNVELISEDRYFSHPWEDRQTIKPLFIINRFEYPKLNKLLHFNNQKLFYTKPVIAHYAIIKKTKTPDL